MTILCILLIIALICAVSFEFKEIKSLKEDLNILNSEVFNLNYGLSSTKETIGGIEERVSLVEDQVDEFLDPEEFEITDVPEEQEVVPEVAAKQVPVEVAPLD